MSNEESVMTGPVEASPVGVPVDRAALIDAARDALVRQHHELFRAGQRAIGVEPVAYDALSDRTKRLQHNQLDPLADAAVDAVLPLIAQAIEAGPVPYKKSDPTLYREGYDDGVGDSVALVRGFLGNQT